MHTICTVTPVPKPGIHFLVINYVHIILELAMSAYITGLAALDSLLYINVNREVFNHGRLYRTASGGHVLTHAYHSYLQIVPDSL